MRRRAVKDGRNRLRDLPLRQQELAAGRSLYQRLYRRVRWPGKQGHTEIPFAATAGKTLPWTFERCSRAGERYSQGEWLPHWAGAGEAWLWHVTSSEIPRWGYNCISRPSHSGGLRLFAAWGRKPRAGT